MVVALTLAMLATHPLHASTAQVNIMSNGSGSITIRVFADELPWSGDTAAVAAYIDSRFVVLSGGRRVTAPFVSARREEDAIIYELRFTASVRCDDLTIWNGVLAERYADQVNLVQVRCAGRSRQLVFSAGDGAKSP